MRNIEKMLAVNKARSERKLSIAKQEIEKMLSRNVEVTVAELTKRTGLSRGFFYNNEEARNELSKARGLQLGKPLVRAKQVLQTALERKIMLLQKENEKLRKENEELKQECTKLRKALQKANLKFIKSL